MRVRGADGSKGLDVQPSTPLMRSRAIHVCEIRRDEVQSPREARTVLGPAMQIGKTTHILELLRWILQAVGVAFQDARRGNARVQPALPVPDRLPELPHPFLVAHVCAEVLKAALSREAVEPLGIVADPGPLLARLLRKVNAVDRACAGLDERQSHLEPEAAVPARDQGDAVGERELVREQSGLRS